ncbi:P-loop containing nucleoside triphosphate hydrolase protein [Cercophora samala]|uniref:P-loop containing nucleoside triphosphate hydrolase protein n=1 Tax=Cercophora samala TaxID=330535 RepID=A0AA40D9B0_9PEZI|nr:P-loop containing nucleoside triphosphate hydrolase protein [Cercophora samala]
MSTPGNNLPPAPHGCRFDDYMEVLYPTTALPSRVEDDLPKLTLSLTSHVDALTVSVVELDTRHDTSSNQLSDSGNEADRPPPRRKAKLRRRSTGGTTHQAKHTRPDGKASGKPESKTFGAASPPRMTLKVTEEADGYASEADMSGIDDYYRPGNAAGQKEDSDATSDHRSRGLSSRFRGPAADSSSDGDYGDGRKPEVFDSDLESEIGDVGKAAHAKKMRKWKSLARDKFEKMLLECIVNTEEIPPSYENIHVDPKVIEKLERVTKMSLLRPKAFGHGVLAGNKVTGAVLWGPPGTGKSLLAKGVARQSGFNMILASTAELWQKCHGDDEKVIKALFSLARKIHPTIVFIDEADAMLGTRKAGEKRHIRAMLNQFLMEWDGLTSGKNSPFILLATNRPFDLDPAVLRRAPMQIHLDIPTPAQRKGILELILREERLGPDVTIEKLVKLTTRYSGSDLKNMCVTAATECVGEQEIDSTDRELLFRHFKSAMANIKATGLTKTMENELNSFGKNDASGSQPQRPAQDDK